ncbi:carbon-nitrogen family hydrolase [Salisediminibacterium halotolerans]|uniref:carbon-nitrogen family hydrolase n=1 Tax=Salisediminibacterium halotolerans TaxID=517425 RepID=UPI000EB3BABF|nr:carbon-nitrogen family hydrolase [Salisediminibacterium halotolerans]RLJ75619.1 putative amidohydrolase [Actinophytocola xinjiangensis]RPE89473.1 putative amidohydrolase [Salisediminibacterium halotolerans]TWG36232.1 putative amidohydrolase [Salisediminibacterium halotolerans]GEL08492.1 carbon-nitrogen hydrolase [Salisediminibacterium halotolerans]
MHTKVFQMDIIPGDPEANRERVRNWFETEAIQNGPPVDLVVLPEMWTTAYTLPELNTIAEPVEENESTKLLQELAVAYNTNIIGGSIAVKKNAKVFNRALVINRQGELIYTYDKLHLVPMLNEPAYLSPGEKAVETFELDGIKMGIIICFDLRFPEIIRSLALQGAKALFIPAEWPASRTLHWDVLSRARAIENQMYVISSNRVGSYDGTGFAGRSMIINPWGDVLAEGSIDQEEVLAEVLDLNYVSEVREQVPALKSRVPEYYN